MAAFECKHDISADRAGGEGEAAGPEDKEAADKALLQRALTGLVEATSPLEGKRQDGPLAVLYFWRRPSHEAVLEAMREMSVDAADYYTDLVNHYNGHGNNIQCLTMRGPTGVVRSVIIDFF
jgi:hypothetical protein